MKILIIILTLLTAAFAVSQGQSPAPPVGLHIRHVFENEWGISRPGPKPNQVSVELFGDK